MIIWYMQLKGCNILSSGYEQLQLWILKIEDNWHFVENISVQNNN